MWDRETKRDLLWIVPLALAVQAFWALRMTHPTYFDAYTYTVNGRLLAEGQGFNAPLIWQYLDDPAGLPQPTLTYWMPLTAFIAAAGYAVAGTFRGAQFPFWLMAGLLPILSYAISRRLSPARWQARTAALFTAAGGYFTAYWAQPSTFVLFAWVGGGCLLALAWATADGRSVDGRHRFWFAAGLLAGLSHLTRADGILFVGVGGLLWLWQLKQEAEVQRVRGNGLSPLLRSSAPPLLLFLAGYFLVMGGWFWRAWRVTGQPLSTVGTETIFLTQYNDIFAYGRHFDLSSYLAWGWRNILLSKLRAVWLAAQSFIGVVGLTAFVIFTVWGWVGYGRNQETKGWVRPCTWYALLLYGVMSLVFTFPGQRGSLLHSSTALWPWSMALTAGGIGLAVDWAAKRLPHWQPERAKPIFAALFIVVAFVISLAVSLRQPLQQEAAAVYRQLAADLPPDAVVMSGDAPGLFYHTGLASISTPHEPPQGMMAAAGRFGANYLLLDLDRPPPLADLYEGKAQVPGVVLMDEYGEGFKLYAIAPEEN